MALSMSAAAAVTRKNIVVIGGGIQGVSVAYHLAKAAPAASDTTITILEAIQPASAASGKGGGFMARGWGEVTHTRLQCRLTCTELAAEVQVVSQIAVLSVAPGTG
jgi:glycine/D-amino acid oxidase-like deaminating enzyme